MGDFIDRGFLLVSNVSQRARTTTPAANTSNFLLWLRSFARQSSSSSYILCESFCSLSLWTSQGKLLLSQSTFYISNSDVRMTYRYGDAAFAFLICHEFAHAIQTLWRYRYVKVYSKLQADCLAGAYMFSIPNIGIDNSDVNETFGFVYSI